MRRSQAWQQVFCRKACVLHTLILCDTSTEADMWQHTAQLPRKPNSGKLVYVDHDRLPTTHMGLPASSRSLGARRIVETIVHTNCACTSAHTLRQLSINTICFSTIIAANSVHDCYFVSHSSSERALRTCGVETTQRDEHDCHQAGQGKQEGQAGYEACDGVRAQRHFTRFVLLDEHLHHTCTLATTLSPPHPNPCPMLGRRMQRLPTGRGKESQSTSSCTGKARQY